MSTFITEYKQNLTQKRTASRQSTHKKTRLKTSDVVLQNSSDIPILLSTIISRPGSSASGSIRVDGGKRSSSKMKFTQAKNLDPLEELFTSFEKKAETQGKIKGVPFITQTSRDAPVCYQCLPTPKDHTLYRIEDIRDKNLGAEDKRVIERERMARLLERQRSSREQLVFIPGMIDMKRTIGRDQYFITKFLNPQSTPEKDEKTQQLSHFQLLLKNFEENEENASKELGFIVEPTLSETEENVNTERATLKDKREDIEFGSIPNIIGFVDMKRCISRENHFLTKQLYRPSTKENSDYWTKVFSTCIFDPKHAKVDPLLNQGNVLDWSRMSKRKPLEVVHYDTDYNPVTVEKHVSSVKIGNYTGRDKVPSHAPNASKTPSSGSLNPNFNSIQSKIKGGKWSKAPIRPKPKLATGEIFDYDRILNRIKDRKKKESKQLQ